MDAVAGESDRDLMRALQGGKTAALEILFLRHHPRIHGFLARLTCDRDAADDLVQEVFLRVLKYRARYDTSRDFVAWLFRIARNLAASHFARHRRDSADDPADWADNNPSTLDLLIAGEDHQQLARAVAALPFAHREVLLLRGTEGLSHRDVALALGCSEGAARVRLHRALSALKRKWSALAGESR